MSEGMILRRGGGGGGGAYGMIVVNYPAGSTLTITGGKASKKDISSTMRIYYVKTAGTYTITATRSGKSASRQVVISAWGQSATITLNYELVLFSYGTEETIISGGLEFLTSSANANITDDHIHFGGTSANSRAAAFTKNMIDVSSYSTIYVTYKNSSNSPIRFGLAEAKSATPSYTVSYQKSEQGDFTDETLDISEYTGEYYIALSQSSSGSRDIYEVRLV